MSQSVTQPMMLTQAQGPYAGQLIAGDIYYGGLGRYFLEKVQGQWQGMCTRFSDGFEAGINRIIIGPDSGIYLGELGGGGNWRWNDKFFGLQRLKFNGATTFEVLTIKARQGGLELQFTQPVSSAITASNFSVDLFQYYNSAQNTSTYGGPKRNPKTPAFTMQLNADHKRVFLAIPSMVEGQIAAVKLVNVQSAQNTAPWTNQYWYTLNKFSTTAPFANDTVATRLEAPSSRAPNANLALRNSHVLQVQVEGPRMFLVVHDHLGRIAAHRSWEGAGTYQVDVSGLHGVLIASVYEAGQGAAKASLKIAMP